MNPLRNLRRAFVLVVAGPLAVACSSSSDGKSEIQPTPSAFAGDCTATLTSDRALLGAVAPEGWATDGTSAPSGTTFLLASDFGAWSGYVIRGDGTPAQIDAPFGTGLVAGTDFTTSCPTTPSATSTRRMTVLADTTLYAAKDLSGTGCALPAGTSFGDYETSVDGSTAMLSSSALTALCGFSTGYARELDTASLVAK